MILIIYYYKNLERRLIQMKKIVKILSVLFLLGGASNLTVPQNTQTLAMEKTINDNDNRKIISIQEEVIKLENLNIEILKKEISKLNLNDNEEIKSYLEKIENLKKEMVELDKKWDDLNKLLHHRNDDLHVKLHNLNNELDELELHGGFSAYDSPEKFDQASKELKRLEFIRHKLFEKNLEERFDLTWVERHDLISELEQVTYKILDLEEEIEHATKWNKLNKEIDEVRKKISEEDKQIELEQNRIGDMFGDKHTDLILLRQELDQKLEDIKSNKPKKKKLKKRRINLDY